MKTLNGVVHCIACKATQVEFCNLDVRLVNRKRQKNEQVEIRVQSSCHAHSSSYLALKIKREFHVRLFCAPVLTSPVPSLM